MLMNFTRKSNFSSIIVTKKIYHGRSAKARRYSIPLNPIDNTIQVTNGWRLPDTELHIFRFEITRNILSIKAANIPGGKTLAQIQLMSCCQTWKKVSALSVKIVLCSRYTVSSIKCSVKSCWGWGCIAFQHCMTNKVGRKRVKLTWIPTEGDT